MTPEEFERLRAQLVVTQTKVYEAMYSTQYLQLPVEPLPYQLALRNAQTAATAAWRAMDVALEKYRRALMVPSTAGARPVVESTVETQSPAE